MAHTDLTKSSGASLLEEEGDKRETSEMKDEDKKICKCPCHVEGQGVMHVMACCDRCYSKYIRADQSIDWEAVEKIDKKEREEK